MKSKLILFLLVFCFVILPIRFASAVEGDILKMQQEAAKSGGGTVSITNPIPTSDPNKIIGMAISAILSLVGAVALLMIVYGGVLWMFAAGNKENITKGKDIIMWTALGMLLIFSSYAIIKFILNALTGKTG